MTQSGGDCQAEIFLLGFSASQTNGASQVYSGIVKNRAAFRGCTVSGDFFPFCFCSIRREVNRFDLIRNLLKLGVDI